MDINNPITKGAGRSEDRGSRIWLITFTDLVALMLTFFVMFFAMSSVKVSEWKNIIDSLSQTLRPSDEQPVPAATSTFNIGTIFRKQAINLDYLSSVLNETVKGQPLLSAGQILRLEGRLIITLWGDLLFEEGGATLTDRGRRSLFMLGGVLQNIGNQVGVNGHSGPGLPAGSNYSSNWELSTAMAAAANAIKQSGYTDDIIAYGYADSRSAQLSDLPEGVDGALVRRIDIVIRPTAGDL